MQKAFVDWVESILKNEPNSINYKNSFIELCKYKCNTNSLFKLYEDINNLEQIVVKYGENTENKSIKLDFYYELSVFISRYKLNIRI
jgi:hypothetical protein